MTSCFRRVLLEDRIVWLVEASPLQPPSVPPSRRRLPSQPPSVTLQPETKRPILARSVLLDKTLVLDWFVFFCIQRCLLPIPICPFLPLNVSEVCQARFIEENAPAGDANTCNRMNGSISMGCGGHPSEVVSFHVPPLALLILNVRADDDVLISELRWGGTCPGRESVKCRIGTFKYRCDDAHQGVL